MGMGLLEEVMREMAVDAAMNEITLLTCASDI